jgi:nicotinate-nucleotide adenylyltransferase
MKIAVYGGSFNPPHVAHVLAVSYVLAFGDVDRVLVVPVFDHAFDKDLADFEHRVTMAELGLGWLPGASVSRIEQTLPTPSRTLATLEALRRESPGQSWRLVVGSDVLFEKHAWHRFDEIERLAPLLVLGRAGHEHPDAPAPLLPEVSSTTVRSLLRSDARDPRLDALVPRKVLAYVREHGLYR